MKNKSMNESTLYVLFLYVYDEGDKVYGIYDKLAYAEKAKQIVMEDDNTIEYGAKLLIKEVKTNQAPVFDFLWEYGTVKA